MIKRKRPVTSWAKMAKTRRTDGSGCRALAFAKGETRKTKKRRAEREAGIARRDVCAAVRARDRVCRACGGWAALEVHEEPPRSQGGDPLDALCCMALCHDCQEARHHRGGERKLWITVQDLALGTAGPVRFRQGVKAWTTWPKGVVSDGKGE